MEETESRTTQDAAIHGTATDTLEEPVRPPELLLELELPFALTLGSVEMELGQIQQLDAGSVVPLGRAADGPVNLVVGGRVIARGELVVVDGCFGIKIDTVETAERRLTTLGRV